MPNKLKTKQLDPTVVRFYMAEDFREEKDGKVSAISLYTDATVLLNIPPTHPDPTPENPAALHSMCFLFNVSKAPAGALVSIDLQGPTGTQSLCASQPMPGMSAADRSANFIIRMTPCVVPNLGTRTFTVTVNKHEFKFDFLFARHNTQVAVSHG
jgi:hypothetical protein